MMLNRSLFYRKTARKDEDEEIAAALKEIIQNHPDHGFWKCYKTLKNEGRLWNHKRVYRVYCERGYNITRFKRKKLPPRVRRPLALPGAANISWSMDFMSDSLANGRRLKVLNIIDDYNREALAIEISGSIASQDVIETLQRLREMRGLPEQIRVDNGPEFIAQRLILFCRANGVELAHIQPGKPTQNAYIERFNGSFRREVLDQHMFRSMSEAREKASEWREYYNNKRPHESLDNKSPKEMTK